MRAAILSILAAGLYGWSSNADAADVSAWETDYKKAKLAAQRSGKPILLTFR